MLDNEENVKPETVSTERERELRRAELKSQSKAIEKELAVLDKAKKTEAKRKIRRIAKDAGLAVKITVRPKGPSPDRPPSEPR